jgi:hypothetical protein
MTKWVALFAGVAALTSFAPATSMAQGIGIDVPGVGVRIGDPYPPYRYYDDGPRVYREGPAYREREVYLDRRDCKTITIRQDGVTKRIRRCD